MRKRCISARIPGEAEHYLINPYGMLYEEITASSLVKIDVEGATLLQPDHGYNVNVAGFYLHAPIHKARPDLQCIIHTHSRAGTAVSGLHEGLLPLSQTAMRFHGRIGYHDFEGPAISGAECDRITSDLGPHDILILRNHGTLTAGRTIGEAFTLLARIERAAEIQLAAQAGGSVRYPSQDAIDRTIAIGAKMYGDSGRSPGASMEWAAFRRKFLAEMKQPGATHVLDALAALSHQTAFSLGCYCENEQHCHRSVLRQLLVERGAEVS